MVDRLVAIPDGVEVPPSFWAKVKSMEESIRVLREQASEHETDLARVRARRAATTAEVQGILGEEFGEVWEPLTPFERREALSGVVIGVVTTPEKVSVEFGFSTDETGLPIWGADGTFPESNVSTGPADRILVTAPPVKESERLRRIREREDRVGWVSGLPKSAGEALRTAIRWEGEMKTRGILRADIARRERLTRARVTQVMSLLELPEEVKSMLLDGEGDGWSVRRALREAR